MTFACTFDAIPRTITSGGSVRFFPTASGTVNEITSYAWDFGDSSSSAEPTPIHVYPVTTTPETFDVTLTVGDASGATCSFTITDFITSEDANNIDGVMVGGTYFRIAIILKNPKESGEVPDLTILTREGNVENPMRLLNVVSTDTMDMIGTLKFTVLDVGDATQAQINFLQERVTVTLVMGTEITFDGVIRRVTKNAQCGYESTNRVNMWDIECDSNLAILRQVSVDTTALTAFGSGIISTPGYILRLILTPTSVGFWTWTGGDYRGVVSNVDTKVAYQLNSSSQIEGAGSRYEHTMVLHDLTNYDLRARPVYKVYRYVCLNEASP